MAAEKEPSEEETIDAFTQMLGRDADDALPEPLESEPDEDSEGEEFLRELFGSTEPETPEPAIEGLAPRDKPLTDYTDEERAAQLKSLERTVRERAEQTEQDRRKAEERLQAEANRTDEQLLGDAIQANAAPGAKAEANTAFIRSIHGGDET